MTRISTSTDVTEQVPEVPGSGTGRVALSPQASELLVTLTDIHGRVCQINGGTGVDGSVGG